MNETIRQYFSGLPKLIMFDLDGTLVDSVPDLTAAIDAMLNEFEHRVAGEEKVRLWVGNGAAVLVRRAMADVLKCSEALIEDDLHRQWLQSFLRHYRKLSGGSAKLYPGVKESLERLQALSIPLVVVTNKPAEFVPKLLRELELEVLFSAWLGGDSLPRKKPDPQPLRYFLTKFNVRPDQALMVGDSRSDILAARAAGVAVVAVSYGYNHGLPIAAENPDWVVGDLLQLF